MAIESLIDALREAVKDEKYWRGIGELNIADQIRVTVLKFAEGIRAARENDLLVLGNSLLPTDEQLAEIFKEVT